MTKSATPPTPEDTDSEAVRTTKKRRYIPVAERRAARSAAAAKVGIVTVKRKTSDKQVIKKKNAILREQKAASALLNPAEIAAPKPKRPRGRPAGDPLALEARGAFKKDPQRRARAYARAGLDPNTATATPTAAIPAPASAVQAIMQPPPLTKDYVAIAMQYANDVVAGKILCSKRARAACERHLRDLKRASTDKSYRYYFDADAANKFCANAERYPHIKGRWAAGKGSRVLLEPWQCFIFVVAFGWLRKDNHKRRFREMYVAVPRKNGKSTLAAVFGNNMLLFDGEHGAEVYSGATSEKQAWEVFGPARLMILKSPILAKEEGVEVWAKALVKEEDNSKFWPVIGNPGDGASPSAAIIDEYHEHPTSVLVDTMVTGMGAREQPMLMIITTAGTNLASPCYDKHIESCKVLDGIFENDELFVMIHGLDEDDDWRDPIAIKKANPNLNVSVDEGFLLAQQRQAIQNPSYQNRFKTKHLNVWCAASVAGINMHSWRQCADPKMTLDQFAGEQAWFSIDLASKVDICCFGKIFKRMVGNDAHYYAFVRHYLPEDTIEEATTNQQAYRKWVTQQHLIPTPGAEIDFDLIREDVFAFASKFVVQEIVYDPWRATQLAHQLRSDGAKIVEMAQSAKNMGEAYDEFTSAIKAGRFHHNGDPVLEWMASNVVTKEVAKGLTLPSKEKRDQKIDGIVAIVMGIARAMVVEVGGWLSNPIVVG